MQDPIRTRLELPAAPPRPPLLRVAVVFVMLLWLPLIEQPLHAQDEIPEVVRELLEKSETERSRGQLEAAIGTLEEARRLGPQVVAIHMALGALHHQRGDLQASLEAFRHGLETLPKERSLLFNAAVVALALERFDEARAFAEKAASQDPKDVDILLVLASALDRKGEGAAALEKLLAADKLRPGDAQIQYRLGNLYHALGRSEDAVVAYRKALKKDPGLLRAQVNLGAALYGLGRLPEALAAYQVALDPVEKALAGGEKVDALYAVAFTNLSAIHRRQGQWRETLAAVENALRITPGRQDLVLDRAQARFELGQLDKAAADYQDVLAAAPQTGPALLGLGLVEAARGRCAPAVDLLERGFPAATEEKQGRALEKLAGCYSTLGRSRDAEKALRTLLAARPNDAQLGFTLGRVLRGLGDREEAERTLLKANELRPGHLPTQLELLVLAETRADLERQITLAEELLLRHAASRPELYRLRASLALLYLENGRAAAALPHFAALEAAIEAGRVPKEERAELLRCYGLALAAAGKYPEARQRLKLATQGGAAAKGALAFVEAMAGQGAAALSALGSAEDPVQRANLGLLLWSLGRGEEARPHLEVALAGTSAAMVAAARTALADLALRRGQAAEAADLLRPGYAACKEKKDGERGHALCTHHLALWEQSRVQLAQAELSRALRGDSAGTNLRQLGEEMLASSARSSSQALAFLVRGTGRLLAGDPAAAATDFEAGLAVNPGELDKSLRAQLAVAQARLGRKVEARRFWESQTDPASRLNLGILLETEGKLSEALAAYREYLEGGGERRKEVEGWVARLREVAP